MSGDEEDYRTECEKLHREAVTAGKRYYKDPRTGYMVFTELEHKARGHCCRSGCRHCPYGFLKENRD